MSKKPRPTKNIRKRKKTQRDRQTNRRIIIFELIMKGISALWALIQIISKVAQLLKR